MMEFRGVRSSWLMLARNCDFSRSSSVRRSFAADSLAVPHGLPVVRVDEFGQRAASRRIPVSRGAFPSDVHHTITGRPSNAVPVHSPDEFPASFICRYKYKPHFNFGKFPITSDSFWTAADTIGPRQPEQAVCTQPWGSSSGSQDSHAARTSRLKANLSRAGVHTGEELGVDEASWQRRKACRVST